MDPTPVSPSGLPKPDKKVCKVCQKEAAPGETLKRCQKCRTVPYCSRACQVADWKQHKKVCLIYLSDGQLSYTGMNFGEKSPKSKKAQGARTRGEALNDLMAWAQQHNGDTLTFACWEAMDLMHDIRKSETHFLAITLRKNAVWTNPRAMYSLVDAEVLLLALLSNKYENVANAYDGRPINAVEEMLVNDRRRRTTEGGALGSVLVMSFELAPDENMTVEEAVIKKSVPVWQPLGLFKEHKKFLSALPGMAHSFWKLCFKNALNGGAYSMKFQPWPAARS